jgi:hypothetical protein
VTLRQDDAVKAAVIHQLRDKWWTPEEAARALNVPLSTVRHWWATDAERVTWTPAMKAQYGKYKVGSTCTGREIPALIVGT